MGCLAPEALFSAQHPACLPGPCADGAPSLVCLCVSLSVTVCMGLGLVLPSASAPGLYGSKFDHIKDWPALRQDVAVGHSAHPTLSQSLRWERCSPCPLWLHGVCRQLSTAVAALTQQPWRPWLPPATPIRMPCVRKGAEHLLVS